MEKYNVKKNNIELSGEEFDYYILSFIEKKEELNNWKNKAVLGFYNKKEEPSGEVLYKTVNYVLTSSGIFADNVLFGDASEVEQ